jgi:hypothetical protein
MHKIRVSTPASTISISLRTLPDSEDNPSLTLIASPGPKGDTGPEGPDPWLDPIQDIDDASGDVEIDYSLGKHVRLTIVGNVTSLSVVNWPIANRIARLTLEILNTGNFDIQAWPDGTLWQSGNVPFITQGAGKKDRIILSTTDAGATIYGDPVGYDYR